MDLEQFRQKLIAAARAQPLSDVVPYGFEKRIMAQLAAGEAVRDPWAVWGAALWRAAMPCVALMCAVTIWAVMDGGLESSRTSLAADLESAVLAPLNDWDLESPW